MKYPYFSQTQTPPKKETKGGWGIGLFVILAGLVALSEWLNPSGALSFGWFKKRR